MPRLKIRPIAIGFEGVSVLVKCEGWFALDAGVEPGTDEVVLSHAHLDHSLYAPGKRVYATLPTLALAKLLLTDAKSLNPELPWNVEDLQRTLGESAWVPYGRTFKVKGAKVTFYNAGHILGSSMILVECDGKKLLYTGDLGTSSYLLDHWSKEVPQADVLIMESSYLCEDRPSAKKEWAKLYFFLKQELPNGPVLIAANAVGKAQEVLKFLYNYRNNLPLENVALEGMAVDATKIHDDMIEYLKEGEVLSWLNGSRARLMDFVVVPKSLRERRELARPGTVVVAPSGSLSGGMSVWWALKGIKYVLLGHVFEPADKLLKGESVTLRDPLGNEGVAPPPALHLKISRHASRQELLQLVSKVGAEKVYLFHGDEECMRSFPDFEPLTETEV